MASRIIPFSALLSPRRLAKTIVPAVALAGGSGVKGHMVIGPGVRTGDPSNRRPSRQRGEKESGT